MAKRRNRGQGPSFRRAVIGPLTAVATVVSGLASANGHDHVLLLVISGVFAGATAVASLANLQKKSLLHLIS